MSMLKRSEASRRNTLRASALIFAAVVVLVIMSAGKPLLAASFRAASDVSIGGPPGPEGVPLELGSLLASASSSSMGRVVDGVACDASEQVVYHIHTHLAVYVNGALRPIPAGIGLAQSAVVAETADGPFCMERRSATTGFTCTRRTDWSASIVDDALTHWVSSSPYGANR